MTAKWRLFEEMVHKIQTSLSPDAQVKLDDRIEGKISGVTRQVDVTVRQKVGQYEILITIECKDLSAPVDVKDVEEVVGLFRDVGSNKGAIVSANGFTEAAKSVAAAAGISVYRLVDTSTTEWKALVALPAVCVFRSIESYNLTITSSTPTPLVIPAVDPRELEICDSNRVFLGKVGDIVRHKWNNKQLPLVAGTHSNLPLWNEPILLKNGNDYYHLEVFFNLTVVEKTYFGYVPIRQVEGFIDEQNSTLIAKQFMIEAVDFAKVEKEWKPIGSPSEIAVTYLLGFEAFDTYGE